jgi:sulfate permease, SulP family
MPTTIPFTKQLPNAFTPILATILRKGYSRQDLLRDALAGVIVGIISLPLAIAFAIASGVSPAQGVVTAVVAGLLTSTLGGSSVQVSGPTGAFIVIVYGIVQQHGYPGLATATVLAGIILVGMGLARFGGVLQFIPFPVIVGFTSGIALIIATGQIPSFLGIALEKDPADWLDKIEVYARHLHQIDPATLLVGAASLGVTVGWTRFANRFSSHGLSRVPGSLVAIVLASLAVLAFHLPVLTIGAKFGAIPSSFPAPHAPAFSIALVRDLFQPALTIAMLGGIESLLSAVVSDGMTGHKHRSNMELVAQGVTNIVAPFFGGIPSTGALARTATNVRNGALSPVSSIVHGLTLLLILLFLGRLAAYIPMATLAGILLVVAYNMSEWRTFAKIFRAPKSDLLVLLLTFALTVVVNLTVAIQVGVAAGAILFIRRMAEVAQANVITDTLREDDDEVADPMNLASRQIPDGVVVYEVFGSFFFGTVEKFKTVLAELERPPKVLVIRMRVVLSIDSSGLHFLEDVIRRCRKEKIRLVLSGVHAQPTVALARAGLLEELGEDNIVANIDQALGLAREHMGLPPLVPPANQAA